jgi:Na+/H+-dicarboxylate symporter
VWIKFFDMLRTAVNITGDAACATIVDSLRDEKNNLKLKILERML